MFFLNKIANLYIPLQWKIGIVVIMNKPGMLVRKGVSPFLSIILVVVFTIGVAIIVSSWLSGYTKSTTETAGEAGTDIVTCAKQIVDITDVQRADDGTLRVRVTNMGQVTTYVTKIVAYNSAMTAWTIYSNTAGDALSVGDEKYYTNQSDAPSGFGTTVYKIRALTLCSGVYDEWTNSTS